jgi:predicted outer membrane lipoprotein
VKLLLPGSWVLSAPLLAPFSLLNALMMEFSSVLLCTTEREKERKREREIERIRKEKGAILSKKQTPKPQFYFSWASIIYGYEDSTTTNNPKYKTDNMFFVKPLQFLSSCFQVYICCLSEQKCSLVQPHFF